MLTDVLWKAASFCMQVPLFVKKNHRNLTISMLSLWTLNTLDVFSEAASRCPPDICIEMGSSPFPYSCKIKETSKKDVSFILVGEAGLEPARPQ